MDFPAEASLAFEWREAPDAQFAVLGDPVAHSLSPRMHAAAFRELGLPYSYVALRVSPGEIGDALSHLAKSGYLGANITVPHKEEALSWLQQIEPFARRAHAVNTIDLRTRSGINTDAPGFLRTLEDLGILAPATVLLLGAGGSARALALAMAETGYQLKLHNRTAARAEELVSSLGIAAQLLALPDPAGCELVVNTTSASLAGEAVPVLWENAESHLLAYDIAYADEPTPFERAALDVGLRTKNGLDMLVEQGALSFEFWLNLPASREAMREAVR